VPVVQAAGNAVGEAGKAGVAQTLTDWNALGVSAGAGFATGIMSQIGPISAAGAAAGAAAVAALHNAVGNPPAPSWMTRELGESVGRGLGVGLLDVMPEVIDTATAFGTAVIGAMTPAAGAGLPLPPPPGAGFAPGLGPAGMPPTLVVESINVTVAGVTDPTVAREVGLAAGQGVGDGLDTAWRRQAAVAGTVASIVPSG
jgi:hypothetical protein